MVERDIGHLKRRFHTLHGEIRLSPEKTCQVIIACVILHGEEEEKAVEDNNVLLLPEADVVMCVEGLPQNYLRYRDHLTNIHFQ